MKQIRKLISIFLILISGILVFTSPGSAAWVSWKSDGNNFWNTDQTMWIEQKASHTFWAQQWSFNTVPAYMGLQTDGNFFNGLPSGELAIFSVWNATDASGFNCGKFSGEGEGYSCRVPFEIYNNTLYMFRVWKLESDPVGQWWGAWVRDGRTNDGVFIGAIRANTSDIGMSTPVDWTECFDPSPCNSVADWTQPVFDYIGNGKYMYSSILDGTGNDRNGIVIPRDFILTPYVTVTETPIVTVVPTPIVIVAPIPNDILSHYRNLGQYPNIVETNDLLKAADDWRNDAIPPGFSASIATSQLLTLADEWRNS